MGRNSNNTLSLAEINLLRCYVTWRKIVVFHCEISPNCLGKTLPSGHILDSPLKFGLSWHMNHFMEHFCLFHSQLQDKSYAVSRHMEPLVHLHVFPFMLLIWNLKCAFGHISLGKACLCFRRITTLRDQFCRICKSHIRNHALTFRCVLFLVVFA